MIMLIHVLTKDPSVNYFGTEYGSMQCSKSKLKLLWLWPSNHKFLTFEEEIANLYLFSDMNSVKCILNFRL